VASRYRGLQPWLIPWAEALEAVADAYGMGPVSVNSVYRSRRQQELLYERYQKGASKYPVAPPGRSLHEHGLAFDINVRQGGSSREQAWLGEVWRAWGGRWSSRDAVHFYVG